MSFQIPQNNENSGETIIFDVRDEIENKEEKIINEDGSVPKEIKEIDDGPEITAPVENLKKDETKEPVDNKPKVLAAKNKDNEEGDEPILKNPVANPIWLSVTEAAKIGGVNNKTIRRAIQSEKIKYRIYKDRYLVGLRSLITFLNSNKKLKNKLTFNGIGQYVDKWRK